MEVVKQEEQDLQDQKEIHLVYGILVLRQDEQGKEHALWDVELQLAKLQPSKRKKEQEEAYD